MRLLFLTTLFSVMLVAVIGLASVLLLQACAVNWPLLERFSNCRPTAEIAAEERLAALDAARIRLEQTVYELERELAGIQCVASGPDPQRPLIDRGWQNQVLTMLHGCWDVSLGYQTRNVDTDAVMAYSDWQMCFDPLGNGRQIMRDVDGSMCEGPVEATFADTGLVLIERDNLPCSDGGYIHRREIQCRLAQNGTAVCSTLQPETGGTKDISLARRHPSPQAHLLPDL